MSSEPPSQGRRFPPAPPSRNNKTEKVSNNNSSVTATGQNNSPQRTVTSGVESLSSPPLSPQQSTSVTNATSPNVTQKPAPVIYKRSSRHKSMDANKSLGKSSASGIETIQKLLDATGSEMSSSSSTASAAVDKTRATTTTTTAAAKATATTTAADATANNNEKCISSPGNSPQKTTTLIGALQKKFSSSAINPTTSLSSTSAGKSIADKSDANPSQKKLIPPIEGLQKLITSQMEAQHEEQKSNTLSNSTKSPKSRTVSAPPLVSDEIKQKLKKENTETTGPATALKPNNKNETATGIVQEDINSKTRAIRKRKELIKELIKTEENYVRIMTFFWEVNAEKAKQLGRLSERDWLTLFGNVEQILGANRTLLGTLKTEAERVGQENEDQCCIGKIFVDIAPYFKLYTDFINNYDAAIETVERLSKHKYFRNYLQECEDDPRALETHQSCSIYSLLINPIQRIPRYQLLLQGILEVTEQDHPDHKFMSPALNLIAEMAKYCNQSKAVNNTLGVYYKVSTIVAKELKYESFIQTYRRYICECQVFSHIDEKYMKVSHTPSNVASSLKESLMRFTKDAILPSPRASMKTITPVPPGEELYNIYLFNDCFLMERDTTASESKKKYTELFFLQYATPIWDNNTLMIEVYIENRKQILVLRPRDASDSDYMIKFQSFRESLEEAIAELNTKYKQKLDLKEPLCYYASERLKIEGKRKVAQKQLNDSLTMAIDASKKLHTIEDEIVRKEEELRRIQEELHQLKEDKHHFQMINKLNRDVLKQYDQSVQETMQQLNQVDTLLISTLNDELASFQKVFADEPCVVRPVASDQDPNDIYNGQKLRRKLTLTNESTEQSSDYSLFEHSTMKDYINRTYGEKQTLFSSMVYQINSNGKAKERRLVITESSLYVILPKMGGLIKKHVPFSHITCFSVSASDDNFFCIHSIYFNDMLFYSTKKTEIVQLLMTKCKELKQDRDIYVQVASTMIFYPSNGPSKKLRFEPRMLDFEFEIVKDKTNELWRVKYDPNSDDGSFRANKTFFQKEKVQIENNRSITVDTTQSDRTDVYKGLKLRRRASIERKFYGDYLSVSRSADIKKFPEPVSSILFFDDVEKINELFKPQVRLLIITEKYLYFADPSTRSIKTVIPLSDIKAISTSLYSDNFFVLHVDTGDDFFLCSEKKTEIMELLQKLCSINVDIISKVEFKGPKGTICGIFSEDLDSSETVLQMVNPTTFNVFAGRRLKSPMVFDSMEVNIDGLGQPFMLYPDAKFNPTIKLPTSSTYYTCTISFYALENIRGYHIEQMVGSMASLSSSTVITSIEDTPKSDKKNTITLKRQKISVSFGRLGSTTAIVRVLDHMGNVVGIFKFYAQV